MLALTPGVAASQGGAPAPSQIVAAGIGEATLVPDRGVIYFAVETRSPNAATAGVENARTQTAVIAAIRAQGVLAEQVTTVGYSVSPNEKFESNGQRKILGYIARNTVVVDVRKLEQVGTLIDVALGAGANSVGGLRYYSTRYESIRRTALENAVARAKADAEVMARAAGGSIGAPIEISANDAGFPRSGLQEVVATGGYRTMAAAAETPVVVGEQKVTVVVSTRWLFVSGR
ncbi:MAG: SIMPL domain-containing protein [Gemmatimonadaceae bacterium]|nr:SIMPL domain-containing protein [Gemmatimonadaceae bacterium]